MPILAGAGMRLVLGLLADRIGARRTALLGLALTAIPLVLGWVWVSSYAQLLDWVVFGDWIFFGATALTLVVFRRRDARLGVVDTGFRAPLYPLFIALVLCGFFYIWKKGVLNWSTDDRRQEGAEKRRRAA